MCVRKEKLKKNCGKILKGIKVIFWIVVAEMVIAALLVCWHEFFPNPYILDFMHDELLIEMCISLGGGGFALGFLRKSGKLCQNISIDGIAFTTENANIMRYLSVTVFVAAVVMPAIEKIFIRVVTHSAMRSYSASLSLLLILAAAFLFAVSSLFKYASNAYELKQ